MSLMDGMDNHEPQNESKSSGGSVDGGRIFKIGLAVVLLVAAAAVIAMNMGLFSGSEFEQASDERAVEAERQFEEAVQEEEENVFSDPKVSPSGAG